jgi:ADP-ribose pyrophosphatase
MMPITEKQHYETLTREIAYNGYFQIVRYRLRHTCFAGGWQENVVREVFERGHAVAVLPYDPIRDEVVLIEQFRIGPAAIGEYPWLLEVVAGIIEAGEAVEAVAQREMQEEAGCGPTALIQMYQAYVSPGGTTETMTLFCGRVNSQAIGGIHGLATEHEDIQVHVVSREQALDWLAAGKICSAPAIIALQWLALNYQSVQQQWR